jgi:hypothetical protein
VSFPAGVVYEFCVRVRLDNGFECLQMVVIDFNNEPEFGNEVSKEWDKICIKPLLPAKILFLPGG